MVGVTWSYHCTGNKASRTVCSSVRRGADLQHTIVHLKQAYCVVTPQLQYVYSTITAPQYTNYMMLVYLYVIMSWHMQYGAYVAWLYPCNKSVHARYSGSGVVLGGSPHTSAFAEHRGHMYWTCTVQYSIAQMLRLRIMYNMI